MLHIDCQHEPGTAQQCNLGRFWIYGYWQSSQQARGMLVNVLILSR